MGFLAVFVLAFSVSLDALAVSVALGLTRRPRPVYHAFQAGTCFGVFQFLMPVIGFYLALSCRGWISTMDHWVSLILLSLVGGKMLYDAMKKSDEDKEDGSLASCGWLCLLPASLATSVDALAVGVTLALTDTALWFPALAMGGVTAVVSAVGVLLGHRFGRAFLHERAMTAIGGIAVILIGVQIFYTHMREGIVQ